MLARCPSDDHQLLYSNERLAGIIDLKNKVEHDGILINDIMRVFKGDNPAVQLERGQQNNGDYFCWQCPLFANNSPNIVHTMSLPNLSLADRVSKVRLTNTSTEKLKKNKLKLYKNLKKT